MKCWLRDACVHASQIAGVAGACEQLHDVCDATAKPLTVLKFASVTPIFFIAVQFDRFLAAANRLHSATTPCYVELWTTAPRGSVA